VERALLPAAFDFDFDSDSTPAPASGVFTTGKGTTFSRAPTRHKKTTRLQPLGDTLKRFLLFAARSPQPS
jgi:hypothetical protein